MRRIPKIPDGVWPAMGLVLALALLAVLSASPLQAHGGAELTVSPSAVTPGSSIQVQGEGVEPGEAFTVRLEGLEVQVVLGSVAVEEDGDFHASFTVPAETPPGLYRIAAVSQEGETLTAELRVLDRAEEAAPSEAPAEPSAAWMVLDRSRSPGEWAVIGVTLLLSTGWGLLLVRERRG